MPSGWTESGIDWNNLSTQSPRDVIRELYVAVSERNYWVKYFGSGGFNTLNELEPIDYDVTQRLRTKEQIIYICDSLSNWLSQSQAPQQNGNNQDFAKQGFKGSFIDYELGSQYIYDKFGSNNNFNNTYYAPDLLGSARENTLIEEIQLGYNSFNKNESGRLEQILQVDLSFLRLYESGQTFRFTYEMMNYVYKILNFLKFVRICTYRDGTYNGRSAVTSISNFNTAYLSQGNGFIGTSPSFNAARDNLYNSVFGFSSQGIIFNPKLFITGFNIYSSGTDSWGMGYGGQFNACTFTNISVQGLDSQIFETEFFDYKNAIYNLGFSYDPFAQISYAPNWNLPSRPLGHSIIDNGLEFITNENFNDININVNPEGNYLKNSFGRIFDGDVPNSIATETAAWRNNIQGLFLEQNMPMINFNKEGFLKYYTE